MPTPTRIRAAAAGLFFRYFWMFLVLGASAAQWSCIAWVLTVGSGISLTWPLHVVAIGALYLANRALTRPRTARRGGVYRLYTGSALIALFCSVFLLLTASVFLVADAVLGVLSAQALTASGQAMLGAGMDRAYHVIGSLGMAMIALAIGYGYAFGQRELRTTRIDLKMETLRGGRPLRITQISDIHVGQNLSLAQLRRFVARVNATAPDLICITGDIADSPNADYATFFPVLGELRARFGVCAILGNHDHYAGADNVIAELRRWTGFRILRDEAVTLDLDGTPLHVIGLDDRGRDWARGVVSDTRLAELLAAAPADATVLLLSHRPDIFRQAAGVVPLTLSGHTHGGQLAIPWFGRRRRNLAEFITSFDRGLYNAEGSYLYVNCGLGVTGLRIRLFTPREISVFELAPA